MSFFPFRSLACWIVFCFRSFSLSFLPPLSPIVCLLWCCRLKYRKFNRLEFSPPPSRRQRDRSCVREGGAGGVASGKSRPPGGAGGLRSPVGSISLHFPLVEADRYPGIPLGWFPSAPKDPFPIKPPSGTTPRAPAGGGAGRFSGGSWARVSMRGRWSRIFWMTSGSRRKATPFRLHNISKSGEDSWGL